MKKRIGYLIAIAVACYSSICPCFADSLESIESQLGVEKKSTGGPIAGCTTAVVQDVDKQLRALTPMTEGIDVRMNAQKAKLAEDMEDLLQRAHNSPDGKLSGDEVKKTAKLIRSIQEWSKGMKSEYGALEERYKRAKALTENCKLDPSYAGDRALGERFATTESALANLKNKLSSVDKSTADLEALIPPE